MEKKDWCSSFPEYWLAWSWKTLFKKVYIGDCCKIHDIKCSTTQFFRCLRKKRVLGGFTITVVAGAACWIKHTDLMVKRWKD